MASADDALRDDIERAVERRSRKTLPPHAALDFIRYVEFMLDVSKFSVRFDHPFKIGRTQRVSRSFLEGFPELIEPGFNESESGGRGMPAEPDDKPGIPN